jgi:LmbE family N-acetylglucosaminyl deacetylase
MQKLLVIAAHPDDEVLGCGAYMRLKTQQNWQCKVVIITQGIAGRLSTTASNEACDAQQQLHAESLRAANVLGVGEVIHMTFPDNRLDTVSRNDIALEIAPIVQSYQPQLVITHHPGDYNWDHTRVFDAVMMAARANYPDYTPSAIWTFEVPSSTERAWQSPQRSFHPNIFIDVSKTIDQKKLAMQYYASEYRDYPHPRSIEAIEYLARKRGNEVGLAYAEAFQLVRHIE